MKMPRGDHVWFTAKYWEVVYLCAVRKIEVVRRRLEVGVGSGVETGIDPLAVFERTARWHVISTPNGIDS